MKNLLRYFLLLLTAGMIITSCQKELSAETGTSKGALVKDAGGNCAPATPNGTFKKDTALTNNNYVDVQVNITEIGVYFITTDTVNGYSFKASGVTVLTGANTIRLIGVGKPLAVGTDNFKVKFDGSVCDFAINVLDANGGGGGGTAVAAFTFGSTAGTCTSTPNGVYAVGLLTNATNYVDLAITVQTAGTVNLSTAQNGVQFSINGTIPAGATSIRLLASGTPTAAGSFSYPITSSAPTSSFCNFNIIALPALTPAVYTINCVGAVVLGDYEVGAIMNPTVNRMIVSVNVTTIGSYNITSTANGVTFIGIGAITSATPATQFITLNATGTAGSTVGNVPFSISGGGGTPCNVTVPFFAAGGGGAATDSISCTVNGTPAVFKNFGFTSNIMFNASIPGVEILTISGDSTNNEGIELLLTRTGTIMQNVPYNVNQGLATLLSSTYTDANSVDFLSVTGSANPTPAFTVTITNIENGALGVTGTRVKGTFAGALKESGGTIVKTITGGYFDLTF